MQSFQERQAKWDEKENDARIQSIRKDIAAAKEQLEQLSQRQNVLDEAAQDLEFRRLECITELENQQKDDEYDIDDKEEQQDLEEKPQTGTFFTIYDQLEEELAEQQGELDASNNLRSELKHRLNKLKKSTEQQTALAQIEESRLREEEPVVTDLENVFDDISAQVEQRKEELTRVTEILEETQQKIVELNEEVNISEKETASKLQEKKERASELEKFSKLEKDLKNQLQESEKALTEETKDNSVAKETSTKTWQAYRASLIAAIKKYRSQIASEQSHAEGNKKVAKDLGDKIRNIVGECDPNCAKAKALCLKEIEECEAEEAPEENADILAENDYIEELERQIEQLTNSLKIFEGCRKQQMSQLNTEYKTSSNKGYIGLLQSEFAELQVQLSKL